MLWKNHQYVPNNGKDKELRALSYLHSQGMNPASLEVIEKTARHKAVSSIDDPFERLNAYGVPE